METFKTVLSIVGAAYIVTGPVLAAWTYFKDRSGSSGRSDHWTRNPRIGADEE